MKKLLKVLFVVMLCFGVVGCSSDDNGDNNNKEVAKSVYEIGETATVEGINITVNSVRVSTGNDWSTPEEGKEFFVMDITLENTKDSDFSSSSLMCYKLKDADGRDQDIEIFIDLNGTLDTTVPSGDKASGEIAFEVPIGSELTLTFSPNLSKSVKIKVR